MLATFGIQLTWLHKSPWVLLHVLSHPLPITCRNNANQLVYNGGKGEKKYSLNDRILGKFLLQEDINNLF